MSGGYNTGPKNGGGGWVPSGVAGLSVNAACTAVRVSDQDAFWAWSNANPEVIQAWDALVLAGDTASAAQLFVETLGCVYTPAFVVHRPDGSAVTMAEYIAIMGGAALGPGASLAGTALGL